MNRSEGSTKKQVEIDPLKALIDYFPHDNDEGYVDKSNPIKRKFCDELAKIQRIGMNRGLDPAATLQMIAVNYHWHWEHIPYGRMDEVGTWIKNNAFRYLQLVHPDNHVISMGDGSEYRQNFEAIEKRIVPTENYTDKW